MTSVPDAAQAPERWFTLPTGGLLYGDGRGGITVGGLAVWKDCPARTAAIHALARWCDEAISAAAALAAAPPTPTARSMHQPDRTVAGNV